MSKIDGGEWGLERVPAADRLLIQVALDRQRCLPADDPDPAEVARWTDQVLNHLVDASSARPRLI